jgi:hypothetical protein
LGRREIERHDPLAEQGDDLLGEGSGEGPAVPLCGTSAQAPMPTSNSARLTVER